MAMISLAGEAAFAASGEVALDFLNLPVGARSYSLGSASYAGITGPEAIFGNPSLLGNDGAFACHQELLLDTYSDAFAAGLRLNHRVTLAAAVHLFSPGEIVRYSEENYRAGTLRAGDRLARLGLAVRGKYLYGFSISYYNQTLDDVTGNGLGFSGGITFETKYGQFAVSADNVGPKFKIDGEKFALPARYSLSAWRPIQENMLNLGVDFSYRQGLGFGLAAGLEYTPINGLGLMAGANSADLISVGMRFTSGIMAIDYSFIPRSQFGDRHIFDISFSK